MQDDSLKKLYVDELKDLYCAENQLVKALPKMAKAASAEDLRQGFEEHWDRPSVTFSALKRSSDPWMKTQKERKEMCRHGGFGQGRGRSHGRRF
jgi:ferritin-like metal-binding protein YciE